MKIEFLTVSNCPHAAAARALLDECLAELEIETPIEERQGDYPSPSILVNDVDVMGRPGFDQAACRLDVPTRDRVLEALRHDS